MKCYRLLWILATLQTYCIAFEPSESFDKNFFLDNNGQYRLFWKIAGDEIVFEVHVATLGWIGLGFSPQGGMTGADIMVGGVKNGQTYIYDRHAIGRMLPPLDTRQDYQSLYGSENSTHTVLKFKRKLDTNDPEDWPITANTINVIWSFNSKDVENENQFDMHTQRGVNRVTLMDYRASSRALDSSTSSTPTSLPWGFTYGVNVPNAPFVLNGDQDLLYTGANGEMYSRHIVMDKGKFHLFWKFNNETVVFEIQAEAMGWVGLGFSPTGGMAGADIVHGFIDKSGVPQISDRFAKANGFPEEDSHQDYVLIRGNKNNTHIIMSFYRKRYTCDPQDMPLTEDTMKLIYAKSDIVPENKNSFQKHEPDARETYNVRLFEKPQKEVPLPTDVKTMDFLFNNVRIPDDDHTLYWCQIFGLPNLHKHHIIRYDPVIQPGNENVVHHMLLYGCRMDMSRYVGRGEPCYDNTGKDSPLMACTTKYLAGWAVGAGPVIYPDNIGNPIFGEDGDKQFLLEVHYDNSNYLKNKIDSSGFRLYLTPTLRPIEGGSMSFGASVGPEYMILPPGQPEYTHYTYCYSDCTGWLPKDGLNAYAAVLHTHLAGRKVRVHHIRNGVQLEDLFADEHYNFNYQAAVKRSKPAIILPNDEFIVECVYNTSARTDKTYGGYSTHEEMCLVFMDVYPRPDVGGFSCFSYPSIYGNEWRSLFNANYDDKKEVFWLNNGTNITAKQFAETQVKFPNQSVVQQFQNYVQNGAQVTFCNTGKKPNSNEDNWAFIFKDGPVKITTPWQPPANPCSKDYSAYSMPTMNHGGSGSSLKSFSNAVIVTTVFEFMFYIRSLFI